MQIKFVRLQEIFLNGHHFRSRQKAKYADVSLADANKRVLPVIQPDEKPSHRV